jgi:hypothetical protein
LCQYEPGLNPASTSATLVPLLQLEAVQKRVDQLEKLLVGQNPAIPTPRKSNAKSTSRQLSYLTPISNVSTPANNKETILEQAFSAIDDLTEYGQNARPHPGCILSASLAAPLSSVSAIWPSILSLQDIKTRPVRWLRSMLANLEAIPDRETVDRLVNHYFGHVGMCCECIGLAARPIYRSRHH